MKKYTKGQIFVFDMILSVVILLVTFSLIYVYFLNYENNIEIYDLNKEILNGFTNTQINSLNDDEVREMFVSNKITNIKNTVAQQVLEFYYNNQIDDAKNLTRIFVENYVSNQMTFMVVLSNYTDAGVVYNSTVLFAEYSKANVSLENASVASFNQRQVFAFKNTTHFYGPYKFEIRIWK